MIYKFTSRAEKALELANDLAMELGHNYIGTEHLLYGLAKEGTGVASKVIEMQDVTPEQIKEEIEVLIGVGSEIDVETVGFTPRTKRVIENAFREARKLGTEYIGTEHLLIGIMREGDSVAVRVMMNLNINPQRLYTEILKVINEDEAVMNNEKSNNNASYGSYNQTTTLNQYGADLTKQAKEGKLDPVIGRKKEIDRVIEILSRRTKNNPCLIGEPGVGKTAVVEGLAEKIVLEDVPEMLKNKRVVSIDISSMVAGAKYRGDFEERIKKCLEEVKKVKDVILFIDEIHTIVGAGSAEGAVDAANILKPLLARGEVQVVGATTLNEYRKYIEKDAALERRFSPVTVGEPTTDETIQILNGIRDKYEAHHNVKISEEAIKAAVNLSVRYINDRFLPDKAIDLMDEAASRVKMKTYTIPDSLKKLEDKIAELDKEKEEAIRVQDFEKAATLRDEENKKKEELSKGKEKWNNKNSKNVVTLTEEDIADVVANWTGIPVKKISQDENERLKNLETELHKRVIGQNEAVEAVAKAIRRGRLGLKDPNRPIGSFLFLGPTGVGKTELCKALAESLFGTEESMIRIDMSEYMEKHTVSKMIGSPPGYVGYEEGGQLTEKIRRKPYSVVLFDEIEKASPDVFNVMLQILDDGHITDGQGRKVDFKNTVIIMTSNAGAKNIIAPKKLGFTADTSEDKSYANMKDTVMAEVKHLFKPEFINRIDDIIVFHPLNEENVKEIVKLMTKEIVKRVKENMDIDISFTDEAVALIAKEGFDPAYGARPLRRELQSKVEDRFAEEFLQNKIKKGDSVAIDAKENELVFNTGNTVEVNEE